MNRKLLIYSVLLVLSVLTWETLRNPDFWTTPDHRGDKLMAEKNYAEAAKIYQDPWRIGVAQFRDGNFKDAAMTFARVPGATGAFNAGDASFMHGAYDQAIAQYDKALGFHPGWKEAEENKALAVARRDQMKVDDKDREAESADAYKPDETVFDQKGDDKSQEKTENGETQSDANLQATWLRRVKTTPADFLKAKFAWQAHAQEITGKP